MSASSYAHDEIQSKRRTCARKATSVADTLSRNPLSVPSEKSDTEEDVRPYVNAAEMLRAASPEKMERIKQAISSDTQLGRVLDCTVNGWPKYSSDVPEEIRPYYADRGDLSVADGKIYRKRLVIPPSYSLGYWNVSMMVIRA